MSSRSWKLACICGFGLVGAGVVAVPALAEYSIRDHGVECESEIGPIPPFNCIADGQIIPITRNGQPIANHVAHQKCDRPPLLGLGGSDGQCLPYARVGTLPGKNATGALDPDIQWAFICRRYSLRTDPNDPKFEDVALIGHNKATGATCFFQMLKHDPPEHGLDATRVPPPSEPVEATPPGAIKAKDFWETPETTAAIGCNSCHDNDPFIHTPYVDQVRRDLDGRSVPLVPAGPNLKANPPEKSRYKFVGAPFQENFPASWRWLKPTRLQPLGNACTTCHNMGTNRSCNFFARLAGGQDSPAGVSQYGSSWPHSHWMPPDIEISGMTEDDWKLDFAASLKQIVDCCNDPSAAVCRRRPFDN
jgi:hypothetical protein